MTTVTNQANPEVGIGPVHASSASVAVDIGPGRGALVICLDERFRDREIEISRVDGGGHRVHTGVHERRMGSGPTLTAIFGSLPAGEYVLWADATTRAGTVKVPESQVAQIDMR
jgi:hypothetical protein